MVLHAVRIEDVEGVKKSELSGVRRIFLFNRKIIIAAVSRYGYL
jgi:hypothetical protein